MKIPRMSLPPIGVCPSILRLTGLDGKPVVGPKILKPDLLFPLATVAVGLQIMSVPADEEDEWSTTLRGDAFAFVSSGIGRISKNPEDYHSAPRWHRGRMQACLRREKALDAELIHVSATSAENYRRRYMNIDYPDPTLSEQELDRVTHVIVGIEIVAGPIDTQHVPSMNSFVDSLAQQYLQKGEALQKRTLDKILKEAWRVSSYTREFALVSD